MLYEVITGDLPILVPITFVMAWTISSPAALSVRVLDVRKSFDARATIDDITSIRAADIEVTKDRGLLVISFAYRKEIRLFSNVSICIDFAASTDQP